MTTIFDVILGKVFVCDAILYTWNLGDTIHRRYIQKQSVLLLLLVASTKFDYYRSKFF